MTTTLITGANKGLGIGADGPTGTFSDRHGPVPW